MGLDVGGAKRLCAYIGEAGMYEDRPLHEALVEQARIAGCAGATVLRGVKGYGATSREHAKHGLRMSMDRPLMVQAVDQAAKITALAEVWAAMLPDGLLTVEDVDVLLYRAAETESDA